MTRTEAQTAEYEFTEIDKTSGWYLVREMPIISPSDISVHPDGGPGGTHMGIPGQKASIRAEVDMIDSWGVGNMVVSFEEIDVLPGYSSPTVIRLYSAAKKIFIISIVLFQQ